MNKDLKYLKDALGVDAVSREWEGKESLPLYLKSNAEITFVDACGTSFLLAQPSHYASLPDCKRLFTQLSKRSDRPVAISVPTADARQRRALAAQGIPFICAGKQASLPFLGMASTEWGKRKLERNPRKKLSPKAQQAAIWGALRNQSYKLADLREATGMSASQASEAVRELIQEGVAIGSKNGREVVVTPANVDELLEEHMSRLSSPVLKTTFVSRDSKAEKLPDAGESALSRRAALNPPHVTQKAASRKKWRSLSGAELLDGELPNTDLLQIQVWKYDPLTAGSSTVDDISLALSLASIGDERIEGEIASLFGKEYPWQEAQ